MRTEAVAHHGRVCRRLQERGCGRHERSRKSKRDPKPGQCTTNRKHPPRRHGDFARIAGAAKNRRLHCLAAGISEPATSRLQSWRSTN